jgi:hypothetical protein
MAVLPWMRAGSSVTAWDRRRVSGQGLEMRKVPSTSSGRFVVPIRTEVHRNMPYFVYRIATPLRLTHLDTKERYQDAKALVLSLREAQTQDTDEVYRMVFAKQQAEAETLLSTPRDERVIGED